MINLKKELEIYRGKSKAFSKQGGENISLLAKVDNEGKLGFAPASLSFHQLEEMGYYSLSSR